MATAVPPATAAAGAVNVVLPWRVELEQWCAHCISRIIDKLKADAIAGQYHALSLDNAPDDEDFHQCHKASPNDTKCKQCVLSYRHSCPKAPAWLIGNLYEVKNAYMVYRSMPSDFQEEHLSSLTKMLVNWRKGFSLHYGGDFPDSKLRRGDINAMMQRYNAAAIPRASSIIRRAPYLYFKDRGGKLCNQAIILFAAEMKGFMKHYHHPAALPTAFFLCCGQVVVLEFS